VVGSLTGLALRSVAHSALGARGQRNTAEPSKYTSGTAEIAAVFHVSGPAASGFFVTLLR